MQHRCNVACRAKHFDLPPLPMHTDSVIVFGRDLRNQHLCGFLPRFISERLSSRPLIPGILMRLPANAAVIRGRPAAQAVLSLRQLMTDSIEKVVEVIGKS